MAIIPTVQPRSSIDVPSSPAPQIANPVAGEFAKLGATTVDLASAWQSMQGVNAEASYQKFIFDETQRYSSASTNLSPDKAVGFATNYDTEYQQRAADWEKENLAGMSPRQQDAYRARLTATRTKLWSDAQDRERGLITSTFNTTLDQARDNSILPRAATVAAMPDGPDKTRELQQVIADGYALIDASPLSEEDKAAKKQLLRQQVQIGFANALPPAERQRVDPTTPDETVVDRIVGVEGAARNPKSSAVGAGQFIDSTWLRMVKQYRPDLAERAGSDQAILALRTGPAGASLGRDMVKAYAAENSAYLKFNDIKPTAGNIYLAHFLGPKGAVDILNADPNASAADINPAAAKSNPTVFYAPGDDGRPDMNQPRTAAEVAAWAGALMAGTYHTDWSRELDAIPYDRRVTIALQGASDYVQQQTETQASVKAAYDARLNDFKNGVQDGRYGMDDVAAAYDDGQGWLTDAGDRQAVTTMIRERDKSVLDLAAAQALVQSRDEINPVDPTQKKAVNLWYDKLAGGAGDLLKGDAQPIVTLRGIVERAQMIPDSAANALKGGLRSTEEASRARAVMIMDGLSRQNPAAYQAAFSDEERKRADVYQRLAPMVDPKTLAEEMDPMVSAATRQARADREAQGLDLARKIDTGTILSHFDETFLWGGTPSLTAIDTDAESELRHDFEAAYAEAYSRVPSEDEAQSLALKWLGNKWGKTDVGPGSSRLIPYPPEKFYPKVGGSHDWLNAQLEDEVRAQFPDYKDYAIVRDPYGQTEADVSAGIPPSYRVVVLGKDGVYGTLGTKVVTGGPDERTVEFTGVPALLRFDYEKAATDARTQFLDKNARAQTGEILRRALGGSSSPSAPFLAPPGAGQQAPSPGDWNLPPGVSSGDLPPGSPALGGGQ